MYSFKEKIIVGVDASNLLGGGGLNHLCQLLEAADPGKHGFRKVIVWGNHKMLGQLPGNRKWLELQHQPMLEGTLMSRWLWKKKHLPLLARQQVDLLLVPGGLAGPSRTPWVTMSRNMLPFERRECRRFGWGLGRLRLEALHWAQSRAFERASGVIFLTEYARNAVCQKLRSQPKNLTVIPHGIAPRFKRDPQKAQAKGGAETLGAFKLLYVSTVNQYKHQWHVAEAVHRLRQQGWKLTLELVGSGYESSLTRLENTIEQLDPSREWLEYLGPIPFEELHESYQAADAFVFASSCENMPNILLEAMAAGLPIACSDRGPMPEVLGDAGFYFDPEDPDQIALALKSLLEDPEKREKMAVQAYEKVSNFSWERCADETFGFLNEVHQKFWGRNKTEWLKGVP